MERSQVLLPGSFHGLRTNAYRYVPSALIELLQQLATQSELAVVVDADALGRSALARIDRVMLLALDALFQVNVQLVLLVKHERQRTATLHPWIPKAKLIAYDDPAVALAEVRCATLAAALLAISDAHGLLACLGERDRGIALGTSVDATDPNIAVASDSQIRAALWWLIDARLKEGIVSWTRR